MLVAATFLRIQSEYGKIRTRITPSMHTIHAVIVKEFLDLFCKMSVKKVNKFEQILHIV